MEKVNISLESDQYGVINHRGRNVIITSRMLDLLVWMQRGYDDTPFVNYGIDKMIEDSSLLYDKIIEWADYDQQKVKAEMIEVFQILSNLRQNIKDVQIPEEIYRPMSFKL